jgi:ABC-2 type transport system ATP-binding protein
METPGKPVTVELTEVTKTYGRKLAVDRLSLSIRAGELFAALGPNGAGKTTTIKMICGLLRPDSGTVIVAGRSMNGDSAEARREIAYVPDQPYLYDKLTGRDILHFIRDIHGLDRAQADRDEEELIATFELAEFVDRLTESYSHGMRQRVAFAAALLCRPKVLVVDEPMVGLDPRSMRIVKNLLRKVVAGGTTVFMSTHTLSVAEELADRIGIFHRGRLIRCGTFAELKRESDRDASLEDFFLRVTDESAGEVA